MLNARLLGLLLLTAALPAYALHSLTGSKMCQFTACMLVLFGLAACVRLRANPETLRGKFVLVSGCDSGIGHALVLRLAAAGVHALAACRSVDSDGAKRLVDGGVRCVQMDVTSDSEVQLALAEVQQLLPDNGQLCAIVHCANVRCSGDLEFTLMRQCRDVMEVNYFGVVRVTQAFLPLLRNSTGRIVTISDMQGRSSQPLSGGYAASKFAVEAAMDAWRLELSRFGLSVVLVQPALSGDESERSVEQLEEQWSSATEEVRACYGEEYAASLRRRAAAAAGDSVDRIVDTIVESLASDAPRDRYLVGDGSKWLALARDWLPTSVHDALIGWRLLAGLPLPLAAEQRIQRISKPWFQ